MRRILNRAWSLVLVVSMVSAPAAVGFSTLTAAEGSAETTGQGETEHSKGPGINDVLGAEPDLAIWSLVAFLLFVWILKKFAWTPLIEGLDRREVRIRQELTEAEEAHKKAEAMLAEHQQKLDAVQDEVREIIAEARRDAEHTKQDIVAEAHREAEATQQRAVNEINRARDAALDELFRGMAAQVTGATEHVLGRRVTEDDQSRLVEEALAQFSRP